MSYFFTPSDFSNKPLSLKPKTYKVHTGHGVMLQSSNDYVRVFTDGLRTCVAFALINPSDQSALLIHFYHPKQIHNDLKTLVDIFLTKAVKKDGLVCLIAGGRAFYDTSETMCNDILLFVKEWLVGLHPIKLRLHAPIIADDDETLSVSINLKTGESQMALCKEKKISEDDTVQMEHVTFVDLTDQISRDADRTHSPLING